MKNKTKFLAKMMLLVLLVASMINMSACVESQLSKGQYFDDTYIGSRHSLRVVSDTKVFNLDDVTFQLNIGIHKKEYSLIDWITTDKGVLLSKTDDMFNTSSNDSNMYFVIYIANPNLEEIDWNENILNYTSIFRLKEISYAESIKDGKYNYSRSPLFGETYYNNCETITIPKEYFAEGEYHTVYIGLYYTDKTNPDNSLQGPTIGLSYHINDDGTVTIGFPNVK